MRKLKSERVMTVNQRKKKNKNKLIMKIIPFIKVTQKKINCNCNLTSKNSNLELWNKKVNKKILQLKKNTTIFKEKKSNLS